MGICLSVLAVWAVINTGALSAAEKRRALYAEAFSSTAGQDADYQAWLVAYKHIDRLHRRAGIRQDPAERAACLSAVLRASAIIAADPRAAGLFREQEEIFLLLVAQAIVESGANPRAVSPQSDLGWAQINRSMLSALGVSDPFDVAQNTAGQARHMRALLANLNRRWNGSRSAEEIVGLSLAAYNASSRAVKNGRIPPGRVTAYVRRVMKTYALLRRELIVARMEDLGKGLPEIFASPLWNDPLTPLLARSLLG